MKTKAHKKIEPPIIPHTVKHGVCTVCGRSGGDVTMLTCPGYRTAADIITPTKK